MIDRSHELALATQARLRGVARSTVYREPLPVPVSDLAVMRRIDEPHLDYPFAGSRMLRSMLVNEGIAIGRTHVRTLMCRMGIEALYRRPRTSKPGPEHSIYPYLLRSLAVTPTNQAWAADITYIPMARGFVYLVVVPDWFNHRVLSWQVLITMGAGFCVEAAEEALARYGKPDIFNTDQGTQFTGAAFTSLRLSDGVAISMDGKGAWRDNAFVERLWRSVKYEEAYLRAYDSMLAARMSIGRIWTSTIAGGLIRSTAAGHRIKRGSRACRRRWRWRHERAKCNSPECHPLRPGRAVGAALNRYRSVRDATVPGNDAVHLLRLSKR